MNGNEDVVYPHWLGPQLLKEFLKSGGLFESAIPTLEYMSSGRFYSEMMSDLSDKHRKAFLMIVNHYALLLAKQAIILDDIKEIMGIIKESMLAEQSGLADDFLDLIEKLRGLSSGGKVTCEGGDDGR